MMRHVSMLVKTVNEINWGGINKWWVWRSMWSVGEARKERELADVRMLAVVGYTDRPTWLCPEDWDQILHLSKATLHQRHSNEVVFYCKLSSRGVCVWVCTTVCVSVSAWKGWEGDKGEARKLKEVGRCAGLSFTSVSETSIYRNWYGTHSMSAHKSL